MWKRFTAWTMAALSLLLIAFLAFGSAALLPMLLLIALCVAAVKRPGMVAALAVGLVAVLLIDPLAFAQEAVAAAPAADDGGMLLGIIPESWAKYMALAAFVLSVGSRLAEFTATDIDDKAFTLLGRVFNLLGGHVTKLNGDASKAVPK